MEKSLQRINRGYKNAMYTSQKSIENKVGDEIKGWKDLLISVGFRFEPATNGIPPSVFFPQNDPGERLTQCSASLQALLGLTQTSWTALSRLLASPEAADEIIALFRQVVVLLTDLNDMSSSNMNNVQVPVNVKLWRVPGCHELLASLGFDLTEVGKEDVTLKMGKSAHRRQIQFALQALLALFDTQEAPRSLDIDEELSEEMDEENDLDEDEQDGQDGYSDEERMLAPYPAPRRLGLRAVEGNGHSSAFTCYVRKRGEPDGRQAGNGDSPTQPSSLLSSTLLPPSISQNSLILSPPTGMYQNQHIKGHESDCNFTPSPVDTLQRSMLFGSPVTGHYHPQNHHHHGAARFQHGSPNKRGGFKNTPGASPLSAGRPDSSSSASSFNEWDHHQHPTLAMRQTFGVRRPTGHLHFPSVQQKINQALGELSAIGSSFKQPLYENSGHASEYTTRQPAGRPVVPIRSVFTDVGYQASLKITDRSDPNDKFSVRTEFGKGLLASQANSTSSISVGSATSSNGSGNRRRNSDIQLSPAAEARLDPGVVKRVPPTGESGSPESTLVNKPSEAGKHMAEVPSTRPTIPPIRNVFADITYQKITDRSGDLSDASVPPSSHSNVTSTPLKQQVKRETPIISEVYHERNLGLGLAPPLSKLILSNNLQVVQVDHHSDSDSNEKPSPISLPSLVPMPGPSFASMGPSSYLGANLIIEDEEGGESFGNFDNLTAIEDAHQRNSFALSAAHTVTAPASAVEKQLPKVRPPVPPKPTVETSWYMNTSNSSLSPTGATSGGGHIHPPHSHVHHHPQQLNGFNFHQRDEGDGRSMSDSQYSGCSPSGQPNSRLSAHKSAKSVASQLSYMKLGEYINDQEITVLEEKEVVPKKGAHSFSPVVIEGPEYMNTGAVKRKQVKSDVIAVIKNDDVIAGRTLQPANHPTGDIKHPQLWSRDRHGGLTYTGRFASDC